MRPRKYTMEITLEAIKGSHGIISTIAKRMTTDWDTAKRYVMRWEETRRALASEEEEILDVAESKLFASIEAGQLDDVKWLLSKKGKKRGYTDHHEFTGEITTQGLVIVRSPEVPRANG